MRKPYSYARLGGFCWWLVAWLGLCLPALATHIRAGEITAKRRAGTFLTYDFTLTVYTDINSSIVENELTLYFGDGTNGTARVDLPRQTIPGANTSINVYRFSHTYSSAGRYVAFYRGVNRNATIINICNAVENNFYIETMIIIDPFLGVNNSPVLLKAPIDQGNMRQKYKHNPSAFDPDGDSLGYEIMESRQLTSSGPISASCYQFPHIRAGGRDSSQTRPADLSIDNRGTMVWDVPNLPGEYNVAIRITEWRYDTINLRRVLVGFVVRDMQILIRDQRNRAPLLSTVADTCVLANSPIRKRVTAAEPDVQAVNMTAFGGPFVTTPAAVFSALPNQLPIASGDFVWQPGCAQVQLQPWVVTFQAEDVPPATFPKLVDLKTWGIKVLGPKPTGLVATAAGLAIRLRWDQYTRFQCPNAQTIDIYRRTDTVSFEPGPCESGLPARLGFELVASVPAGDTTYLDNNRGQGLKPGRVYWYRIVARFPLPGLGESFVSESDSARLKLQMPLLYKIDVTETDSAKGKIRVEWTRPLELDEAVFTPPYQYRLMRASQGTVGNPTPGNYVPVFTTANLRDTVFTDTLLNTRDNKYLYRLVFTFQCPTCDFATPPKDSSQIGESVYLTTTSQPKAIELAWRPSVPWGFGSIYQYIYKEKPGQGFFLLDSVRVAANGSGNYRDDGSKDGSVMPPGVEQRYFVTTRGQYSDPLFNRILPNRSQIQTGFVADTIVPCPPQGIGAASIVPCQSCEDLRATELFNVIKWEADTSACDSDVVAYNIYFTPYQDESPRLVGVVSASSPLQFSHSDNGSLAGCYQIAAVDRSRNESGRTQQICVENCPAFDMPNVFTPNGDGWNENFSPRCYIPAFIQQARLKIYNRWGQLLFTAPDADPLLWNGDLPAGAKAPSGTYFYVAEVRFKNTRRNAPMTYIKGWVQLIR